MSDLVERALVAAARAALDASGANGPEPISDDEWARYLRDESRIDNPWYREARAAVLKFLELTGQAEFYTERTMLRAGDAMYEVQSDDRSVYIVIRSK